MGNDRISEKEYTELEKQLRKLYRQFQDLIDKVSSWEVLDLDAIERRAFDQGQIGALQSILPFADGNRIMFDHIKDRANEFQTLYENLKGDADENDQQA